MEKVDQEIRSRIIGMKNPSQKDLQKISNVDKKHNRRLKEIIRLYGWPGVSDVGVEGVFAMWLLIQHQDFDIEFQKECLELLETSVQANESPMKLYAYLIDRVHKNLNIPQVYGTQWIQEEGMYVIYDVEDFDNLDQRRQEAGLCSISEYKKSLKEVYQLTDEDFK